MEEKDIPTVVQLAGRSMVEYLEARIRELEQKLESAVLEMHNNNERIRELEAENARLRDELEAIKHADVYVGSIKIGNLTQRNGE